jgi:hypothetical protein
VSITGNGGSGYAAKRKEGNTVRPVLLCVGTDGSSSLGLGSIAIGCNGEGGNTDFRLSPDVVE